MYASVRVCTYYVGMRLCMHVCMYRYVNEILNIGIVMSMNLLFGTRSLVMLSQLIVMTYRCHHTAAYVCCLFERANDATLTVPPHKSEYSLVRRSVSPKIL